MACNFCNGKIVARNCKLIQLCSRCSECDNIILGKRLNIFRVPYFKPPPWLSGLSIELVNWRSRVSCVLVFDNLHQSGLGPRGGAWPNPPCIQGETRAQKWDVYGLTTRHFKPAKYKLDSRTKGSVQSTLLIDWSWISLWLLMVWYILADNFNYCECCGLETNRQLRITKARALSSLFPKKQTAPDADVKAASAILTESDLSQDFCSKQRRRINLIRFTLFMFCWLICYVKIVHESWLNNNICINLQFLFPIFIKHKEGCYTNLRLDLRFIFLETR